MAKKSNRLPNLPQLLARKIYKTGQTRGADDDDIIQNRVGRNSTALFPYSVWKPTLAKPNGIDYENSYIVLINPKDWYEIVAGISQIKDDNLKIGKNLLVFYEKRSDWLKYPPNTNWSVATTRPSGVYTSDTDLGGEYVARIPGTTAQNDGEKIIRGFSSTKGKGAGIQGFEYASSEVLKRTRYQLELIFWNCFDATDVIHEAGMSHADIMLRKSKTEFECQQLGLDDKKLLRKNRIIDRDDHTICPLCLEKLSARGFISRLAQAEGREVDDLTVTEVNLFHIKELRYGIFLHSEYNLGWGHHHCNTTARDLGIDETLLWMQKIVERNASYISLELSSLNNGSVSESV